MEEVEDRETKTNWELTRTESILILCELLMVEVDVGWLPCTPR